MFAFLPVVLAVALQQPQLQPTVQLAASGFGGAPTDLVVDADRGQLFALWGEYSGSDAWIVGAASEDGGRSWSTPAQINSGPTTSWKLPVEDSVLVANGYVHTCWLERRSGQTDAYLRTRRPDGTWAAELRLDDGFAPGAASVGALRLRADPSGTRLLALMEVAPGGGLGDQVVLLQSTDAGATWSGPQLIHAGGAVEGIDLAVVGTQVHVVWQHSPAFNLFGLKYRRSNNGGSQWTGPAEVLGSGIPSEPGQIDLHARGDRVAVAFAEVSALCGVSVVASEDRGLSWTGPTRVAGSLSPGCMLRRPRVFHTVEDLVVGWVDDRFGGAAPYLAASDDLGVLWRETALAPAVGADLELAGDAASGVFAASWISGGDAQASWSRGFQADPRAAFDVANVGPSLNVQELALAHDASYGAFSQLWIRSDGSVHASAFRNAQVEAVGNFTPGGQVGFTFDGFPESEAGDIVQLLVSTAPGALTLPFGDGRDARLGPSAALSAVAGNSSYWAALQSSGVSATNSLLVPPTLAPGTVLHFAAVTIRYTPTVFGSLTLPGQIIVQ